MLYRYLVCIVLTALSLGTLPIGAAEVGLSLEPAQKILPSGSKEKSYLKIALKGFDLPIKKKRPPINVALVLDRSGSMSGAKIAHAKEAAIMALDYLQSDDTLAVVIYDHEVEVLIPSTPLQDRAKVEKAIKKIKAKGRTALHAGVTQGAKELRKFLDENRVNRMILLSDGLANVGPSTPAQLGELGRKLGGEGLSVTTIGLGLGYNEDLMVRLAGASDGNHVFAETPSELAEVFKNEFGELVSVIANDVIIIIHCKNGVKPLRALGRDAEIDGNKVQARMNQLYAQQEKYFLLEVELPEGKDGSELELGEVEVRYNNLVTGQQDKVTDKTSVSYSESKEKASSSVNKSVMVSASEQIGAEMDEAAVSMKDKGDAEGAGAMLRQKADYLKNQAQKFESKRLMEQSERSLEAEKAVAAPAESSTWNKARKALRADQYSIKKQQSYK